MLTLPSALEAEQRKAVQRPYVALRLSRQLNGLPRLLWERLYTGSEAEAPHGMCLTHAGSLIRARQNALGTGTDVQRVATPGPSSDFATYSDLVLGKVAGTPVACAARNASGGQAAVATVQSNPRIRIRYSANDGSTWPSVETVAPTASQASALAIAYRTSDGDMLCIYNQGAVLHAVRRTSGAWGTPSASPLSFAGITGLAVMHDGLDWAVAVTGTDSAGTSHVWLTMYGDGNQQSLNTWMALKPVISSPAGLDLSFHHPSLWPGYRLAFTEQFAGTPSSRRAAIVSLPGAWGDDSFSEPLPHEHSGEFGADGAADASYHWLSNTDGVWRAPASQPPLEVDTRVLKLRLRLREAGGTLEAHLDDHDGALSAAAQVAPGAQVELRLGLGVPGSGNLWVQNGLYFVRDVRRVRLAGQSSVVLLASDAWWLLSRWQARRVLQWSKGGGASLDAIAAVLLRRAGLGYSKSGSSSVWTGLQPAFALHPGQDAAAALRQLVGLAPDVAYWQNGTLRVREAAAAEAAVYAYGGAGHPLRGLVLTEGASDPNRLQAIGDGARAERFRWQDLYGEGEALLTQVDLNRDSGAEVEDLAAALLRKAEIGGRGDLLVSAPNAGVELYDVVEVTEPSLGLSAAKRRVLGISLDYEPARAVWEQTLELGLP